MTTERQLRVGAICALTYVAVFIFTLLYVPHLLNGATTPTGSTATKTRLDLYVGSLLAFARAHQGYYTTSAWLSGVNYALLLGVVFAVYRVLSPIRLLAARITGGIGAISVALVIVDQAVFASGLLDHARQYVAAVGDATKRTIVHRFEDSATGYQVLDIAGINGLAIWVALVGVTLLRIQGMRSTIGWASVVAGVLLTTGFPTLPLWTFGAGIGLWRASQSGWQMAPAAAIAEDTPDALGAGTPMVRRTPPRAAGARGSGSRNRRRRR